MENSTTVINWTLNDFCKSECSYCPVHLRGGETIPETSEYIRIANLLIENYKSLGQKIYWTFNGGEPLDMNDIVTLLKLCRTNGEFVELTTNGGRLWMDWWAIEPYVDNLHLTYHYWQNPALIKYIVDIFKQKNKSFNVTAPVRPDFFDEDIDRILKSEETCDILINKTVLYNNADGSAGMFPYTNEQLESIARLNKFPSERDIVEEKIRYETTTWEERYQETYSSNPSYTHQLCNAGIEKLNIGAQGWVSGSNCNNIALGNIWHQGWCPPNKPQKCGMLACVDGSDQLITKFPLIVS